MILPGATCFVADDDEDDQEIFLMALKQSTGAECNCVFANDGRELLGMLGSNALPHYIFLDLNMPVLNGLQCLEAIRQEPRYNDIPVVIYTTSDATHNRQQALKAGANAYITKPTNMRELVGKLNEIFTPAG